MAAQSYNCHLMQQSDRNSTSIPKSLVPTIRRWIADCTAEIQELFGLDMGTDGSITLLDSVDHQNSTPQRHQESIARFMLNKVESMLLTQNPASLVPGYEEYDFYAVIVEMIRTRRPRSWGHTLAGTDPAYAQKYRRTVLQDSTFEIMRPECPDWWTRCSVMDVFQVGKWMCGERERDDMACTVILTPLKIDYAGAPDGWSDPYTAMPKGGTSGMQYTLDYMYVDMLSHLVATTAHHLHIHASEASLHASARQGSTGGPVKQPSHATANTESPLDLLWDVRVQDGAGLAILGYILATRRDDGGKTTILDLCPNCAVLAKFACYNNDVADIITDIEFDEKMSTVWHGLCRGVSYSTLHAYSRYLVMCCTWTRCTCGNRDALSEFVIGCMAYHVFLPRSCGIYEAVRCYSETLKDNDQHHTINMRRTIHDWQDVPVHAAMYTHVFGIDEFLQCFPSHEHHGKKPVWTPQGGDGALRPSVLEWLSRLSLAGFSMDAVNEALGDVLNSWYDHCGPEHALRASAAVENLVRTRCRCKQCLDIISGWLHQQDAFHNLLRLQGKEVDKEADDLIDRFRSFYKDLVQMMHAYTYVDACCPQSRSVWGLGVTWFTCVYELASISVFPSRYCYANQLLVSEN